MTRQSLLSDDFLAACVSVADLIDAKMTGDVHQ